MIKATMTADDGRTVLLIGLSHKNLDRLKADGLKGYIPIRDIGLPIDVLITAGSTEAEITEGLKQFIGPDTVIHGEMP